MSGHGCQLTVAPDPKPARRSLLIALPSLRLGIDFTVWALRQCEQPDAFSIAAEFNVDHDVAQRMLDAWIESAADAAFNAPGIEHA